MHEKTLTRAEPPRTFLERLDPRAKLVCVLVWAVCVVTMPEPRVAALMGFAVVLIALIGLNHTSAGRFVRRFAAALPFIVLLTALLPFLREGQVIWQYGAISVTLEGIAAAARVGTSALLCVAAVCLVWATTPEPDLIAGLQGLGLPGVFVGAVAFMLRYLHVLRPELHRLCDARAARSIGHGTGPLRSGGNLLGAFFLRSHGRALRVADAMAARGYDGHPRRKAMPRMKGVDLLCTAGFITMLIAWRYVSCS